MTFNEPLARAALAAVRARPDQWDQETWRCGTGMCFAGFVAVEAGARWVTADLDDPDAGLVVGPDGKRSHVADFAAEALGVDPYGQFDRALFSVYNTLDDLDRLVGEFATVPESAPGPDHAPPVGAPGADPTPAAHGGTPAVATAPAGGSLRPAGGGSGLPQDEPDGLPHPPGTRPAPIPDAPGASGASPARPTTGGRGAGRPAAGGGASPPAPAPSSSGEVAGSASASTLAQGKHASPDDDPEGEAAPPHVNEDAEDYPVRSYVPYDEDPAD
jgi:hypothetical protein